MMMSFVSRTIARRMVGGLISGSVFLLPALLAAMYVPLRAEPARNAPMAVQERLIGTVTTMDPEAGKLSIRTDDGKTVSATLAASTRVLLVPPGETNLEKATEIAFTDIRTGDRVLVRGQAAGDGPSFAATLVVVMSQSDLQRKRKEEIEAWRTRGVFGRVTSIDETTKEINIQSRTLQETKEIVLEVPSRARIRRYPPGAFRFADAHPSSFDEIRVGDQLQVLGEKNEDGTRVKPEEIVAGSFRTFAATVTGVDASSNRLEVKDLETGKPVTIHASDSSALRRLPERMARILALSIRGQGAGGPRSRGGLPGGNRRGRPALGFQQVLARAPDFPLAELKPGEALIISCATGEDDAPWNAISILAGVEPLLTARRQERGPVGGTWNFDINVVQ